MKKILLFLLISISTTSLSNAQSISGINIVPSPTLTCSDKLKGTAILYVNGQENEYWEAEASVRLIIEYIKDLNLKDKIDQNGKMQFDFVHNPTMGKIGGKDGLALADFIESAALILQTQWNVPRVVAWGFLYNAFILGINLADTVSLFSKDFVIDQRMIDAMKAPYFNLMMAEHTVTEDLKDSIKLHMFGFQEKLIVISHSQGNLFINQALQELSGTTISFNGKNYNFDEYTKFLGNSQIATPANHIEIYKNNYITNHKDSIQQVPGHLATNFPLSRPYTPPALSFKDYDHKNNHSLSSAYLFGRGNSDAILLTQQTIQNWVNVAGKLESNCAEGFHLEMTNVSGTSPFYYLWLSDNFPINGTQKFIDVPEPGEYRACIFDGSQNLVCKRVYVNNSICELISFDENGSLNFDVTCDGVVATIPPVPPLLP